MTPEGIIEYMYSLGSLKKEYVDELIPKALAAYKSSLRSSVFKLTIEPIEAYKEFTGPEHTISINKEADNNDVEIIEEDDD